MCVSVHLYQCMGVWVCLVHGCECVNVCVSEPIKVHLCVCICVIKCVCVCVPLSASV